MAAVQQPSPSQNAIDGSTAPKKITHSDPSAEIFSLYTTHAQKFDEENVENWNGSAQGILVFTGLFSSTVATFIAMSYPDLKQDPNDVTHALLRNISQQLPNANILGSAADPPIPTPFVPPKSVVFINSAWFLSLVLSLTCALMATLLQQWGRRYLQMIQRNHAPHLRAHIHEYFSKGTRRFHIFGLVEVLLFLLLLSVILFFAGLVAFAYRANHTVAYFTIAIVGLCILSYIFFTLVPFFHHDCPYQTPVTFIFWYGAQKIVFSGYAIYLFFGQLFRRWFTAVESVDESWSQLKKKAKYFSEGKIPEFENSAKLISVKIYKKLLTRTLDWLREDHELEKFVAGIPGLFESKALSNALSKVVGTSDNDDPQRTIRGVVAALPGPTSFHASLSWSIMYLAQRAIASSPLNVTHRQRTRACLRALYYIPGAIRDVLAPYAAEKDYFQEILPLLNSPDSMEIIEELWDTRNSDVSLSVRCVAAVVYAFTTAPPHNSVTPNASLIEGDNFLSRGRRVGIAADYDHHSDSARLQNLVCFLGDIKDKLKVMSADWWSSNDVDSIRQERRTLFDMRRTEEYRTGRGTFDQQGDRVSPAFVPAAQQDLISLTLEILSRDPVKDAATSRCKAFRGACTQLTKVAAAQAQAQARTQTQVLQGLGPDTLAQTQVQAADSIKMIERALEPVLKSLGLPIDFMSAPQGASGAGATTQGTGSEPVSGRIKSASRSSSTEGFSSQPSGPSTSAQSPSSPTGGGTGTREMVQALV